MKLLTEPSATKNGFFDSLMPAFAGILFWGGVFVKWIRDPVSCLTHLGGAVLSVIGMAFLLLSADGKAQFITFFIYGLSLILLFSASTAYHMIPERFTRTVSILRKVDHSMIFVLIAGSYTPILYTCFLDNIPLFWAWILPMWIIVCLGIFLKIFLVGRFRWLSTLLYLALGWYAIFIIKPLVAAFPVSALVWMLAGGIAYTTGAVMYALKKPRMLECFGFHDLFHIFVMVGAACHFVMIFVYC